MKDRRVADVRTDGSRWQAVVRRDPRADGAFLYAVKTTGVYCRPVCSSRMPNRRNVVFFAGWPEAERAGYRACKKCRPGSASLGAGVSSEAIVRACKLIEESEGPPRLEDLAEAVGLSPRHVHRLFKKAVGLTPKQFAAGRRSRRLEDALLDGKSVTKAIYDAGFGSSSRFYETAADTLGMAASSYRRGAEGVEIRFAVAASYLGWVLVAATQRGICAIELGDTPEALRERLSARFPKAELADGDPGFAAVVEHVVGFIEAPEHGLDLPLDIQGTAFQRRVWQALRAMPVGAMATYTEIAERIDRPAAARAVANACAANPVAIGIPCHRVVRRDGRLGGYRWGLDRKRRLLARERAAKDERGRSR